MDSRRRFALILAITFPLLSLISNTAQTETGRVSAKASAGVSKRSGKLALDASSDYNALLNLLLGHTASHAFNEAAWAAQPSALPQAGMTFTVNSTADPGTGVCDAVECTLREAIAAANAHAGADTIVFNIPGVGTHTISPTSPLPIITVAGGPLIIDGYTQPGASANTLTDGDNAVLMIELDGSLAGALNMISISAGSSTVRGLVINHAAGSRAINVDTNGGNTIEGNFIGTNVAGSAASGNTYGVIVQLGSSNNIIGGTTTASRNIISGNNTGIALFGGPGNLIEGNFIGTDHTGSNDLGNDTGITISGSPNNTIGGTTAGARNVISGNGTGISSQADNNLIQGNYIGISATGGAFNYSNTSSIGVSLFSGSGSTIGGTTASARNVISGNSIGISLNSTPSPTVQGNFIGTDATGTIALGNTSLGINMQVSNNTLIGGTSPGAGNLISANGIGIQLSPGITGATIQVQGNLIGTDVNGTADLGNTGDGIVIGDATTRSVNLTIGGTIAGARNVISGNDGDGIELRTVSGTVIQGNLIGTQIDGTSPLGNGERGLNIVGTSNTTIGGTSPGAGNRIAFNGTASNFGGGILISGTSSNINNSVRGNSIFANTSNGTTSGGGLGIDLSSNTGDGPTANDSCDGDTGSNNLQNFPVITNATSTGGTTTIQGTLNSTANTAFTIDFYSNPACDSTGYGEGQTFLGSGVVTTDGSCNANINITLPATVASGQVVTATATDPAGNTSEFSQCVQAIGMNPPVASNDSFSTNEDAALNASAPGVLSNDTDPDPGTMLTAQLVTGPSNGTMTLNQNGSFTYTPVANFNGTDSFTYRASDGTNTSNTATAQITVNPVNDAPVADSQSVTTNEDTAHAITLTGSDVEASALTYSVVTGPAHGALSGTGANRTYTPATNYDGTDTFTFKVNDGTVDSNIATVQITINAVNDAPIATNDTAGTNEDTPVVVAAPGVLSNDTDVENDPLTATLVSSPSNGTLAFNRDGSFTYTPNITMGGTDSFTYRAGDASLNSNVATVNITVTATPTTVQFDSALYSVQEDCTGLPVTVRRTGDTSGTTTLDYLTTDGTATQRTDYTLASGRLTFAPGETTKIITLLISEDSFVEGTEFFTVSLSNVTGGSLGALSMTTIQIVDDATEPATNAIDQKSIFVCQHYHDFLNREPEPAGLQGWLAILTSCSAGSKSCDAVEVSSAFYRSDEFQQRGFFLYRFYATALARAPRYLEFMTDLSRTTGFLTDQQIEDGKAAFVQEFISRQEFKNLYDSLTDPADYVNALLTRAGVTIPNKQQLIDDLRAGRKSRADVLRNIAESPEVGAKCFNEAFVVMQYFGYLRRDPDILYLNWIQTLNQTGDYRTLVNGFVNSLEYRSRFAPP